MGKTKQNKTIKQQTVKVIKEFETFCCLSKSIRKA